MIEVIGGFLATGGLIWFVLGRSRSHITPRKGIRHGDPNPDAPDELWGVPFEKHEKILQRKHWQQKFQHAQDLAGNAQERHPNRISAHRHSGRLVHGRKSSRVGGRVRKHQGGLALMLIVVGLLAILYFAAR
jgi:hypothetical protein